MIKYSPELLLSGLSLQSNFENAFSPSVRHTKYGESRLIHIEQHCRVDDMFLTKLTHECKLCTNVLCIHGRRPIRFNFTCIRSVIGGYNFKNSLIPCLFGLLFAKTNDARRDAENVSMYIIAR